MRRVAHPILAIAVAAYASVAGAKEFQLPDANPAVSIVLPDSWKPADVERGVEANSPDGETYVAVETAPKKDVDALISDDIDFLKKSGVTLDTSTQKSENLTLNGMPTTVLHWNGKDKDGPTLVELAIVGSSPNLLTLVTYWSSPAGNKTNGPAFETMIKSLHKL